MKRQQLLYRAAASFALALLTGVSGYGQPSAAAAAKMFDGGVFGFKYPEGWRVTERSSERAAGVIVHPVGSDRQHFCIAVRLLPYAPPGEVQHERELKAFLETDPRWTRVQGPAREDWPAGEAYASILVNRMTGEVQCATHFATQGRLVLVMYQAARSAVQPEVRQLLLGSFWFRGQQPSAPADARAGAEPDSTSSPVGRWTDGPASLILTPDGKITMRVDATSYNSVTFPPRTGAYQIAGDKLLLSWPKAGVYSSEEDVCPFRISGNRLTIRCRNNGIEVIYTRARF
jgi:hypothetical protein